MQEEIRETRIVRLWYSHADSADTTAVPAGEVLLSHDEMKLLDRVLSGYLSDLRAEVVSTDNPSMRRELREEQAQLEALLTRLKV